MNTRSPKLLVGLCAFTVVCSVVLGGATRSGFLSDGILQYLSLPLLLLALWRSADLRSGTPRKDRSLRWELLFCGALVVLPLLQLVPLPASIWMALPGRKPETAVFELLGEKIPWMPISISPEATWLSALSLLPPLAIFLGCLLLGYRERREMSVVVLSVSLISVFLGLIQVSQGPSSPLRFFEITNPTEAVGFFANRNHLAALLYAATPLAAAWAVDAAFAVQSGGNRNRYDGAAVVTLVASFTLLLILVSAQTMARSRAGLGLTIIAVFGAFALACFDPRVRLTSSSHRLSMVTPVKLLLGAIALAVMFAVQFTLYRLMERFVAVDLVEDTRVLIARSTIEAAKAYMPFGSGMGTFVPVYAMYEKPQDVMANVYVNHAHNDVFELWLETGVGGIVLMGVFVTWLALRSIKVWRHAPLGGREIDHALARASTLIVGLLVIHSFLDYPLRTDAMMAITAFACALLIDPPNNPAINLQAMIPNTAVRKQRQIAYAAAAADRLGWRQSRPAHATIPSRRPADSLEENTDLAEKWRTLANSASFGSSGIESSRPFDAYKARDE